MDGARRTTPREREIIRKYARGEGPWNVDLMRLRADVLNLLDDLSAAEAERDALQAHVAVLREALAPFGETAEGFPNPALLDAEDEKLFLSGAGRRVHQFHLTVSMFNPRRPLLHHLRQPGAAADPRT